MPITFKTSVRSMNVENVDNLKDVVVAVNWSVMATDGKISVTKAGATKVNGPDPSGFIAFNDLDESTVLSWIEDPSTPDLQQVLSNQLTDFANKPSLSSVKRAPWITQPRKLVNK